MNVLEFEQKLSAAGISKEKLADLDTYEAEYIFTLIRNLFPNENDKLSKVYLRAISVGMFHTENCIEALIEGVGLELAPAVLYDLVSKGYMFSPKKYLNESEAFTYLKKHLPHQAAADLLTEHPEFLYLFKITDDEAPAQNARRKSLIEMYKQLEKVLPRI